MSKKKFFPRNPKKEVTDEISEVTTNNNLKNSEKVVCATFEIKEMVTKWTQNIAWEFDDFATFVEQAGVKTPIKLIECTEGKSDWGKTMAFFKCIATNKEIEISIAFDKEVSELWIMEEGETRKYTVDRKWVLGESIPKAIFEEKIVKRNNKEIRIQYSRNCEMYKYTVCKNGETFEVCIDGNWKYETADGIEMRYFAEKEEYVFSVRGGKNQVMTTPNPSEILTRVEEKISELMKFVR